MRFRISFNRTSRQRMLPMDYQYYISAWIYKVLKQADSEYAQFLHEQGYGNNSGKLYKLFCFSKLNFGKPSLWKEQKLFEIKNHQITLEVSFDVNEAASNFIKGLFSGQEFFLGNRFNGIDLKVVSIEALPEPVFNSRMNYRLASPWVVSYQNEPAQLPQYLSPNDANFNELSVKHIIEKYNNTRDSSIPAEVIQLSITSQCKRAGFLIKPGTAQETRIVGNLFDFSLEAPASIHQMIWNAGISEKSSSGFGWIEIQ